MKNAPDKWLWFGSAGHLIVSDRCRFHLCTQVGNYLVSTVGQYWPDRPSREIHAQVCDPEWLVKHAHRKGDDFDHAYMKRFGYETIGVDRTFETMVFAAGAPCASSRCGRGMPDIDGDSLDFAGYNSVVEASAGHLAMCLKWASKEVPNE